MVKGPTRDPWVDDYKFVTGIKSPSKELEQETKRDAGKTRWDLLPAQALEETAKVFTFGLRDHEERSAYTWTYRRAFAALMRHAWAWWRGEDKDEDSGLSHMAHAAFNVLLLLELEQLRPEQDDRPKEIYERAPSDSNRQAPHGVDRHGTTRRVGVSQREGEGNLGRCRLCGQSRTPGGGCEGFC